VKGRVIGVRQASDADVAGWRDLAVRAVEPNPLYEPACVIPAARHQTFGHEIGLLVAEEGGRMYACVPIRDVARWYKMPYRVVTSQVRRMGYLGTPLVDADRGEEAMRTLLATLVSRRRVSGSRLFALEQMTEGGPVAGYVDAAAAGLGLPMWTWESFERGFMIRRTEPTYKQTQSRRHLSELRRRRRRLAEMLGAEPVVVDRSDDPAAVNEFIAMESAGYKARNGVAMATVPGEPAYFRDMCRAFASENRLCLLTLAAAGHTVAMQIWLRGGEALFMIKVSYDEAYGHYAPGVQLHIDGMDYFHHRTDAKWMDVCTFKNNDLLLRLYPDRRRVRTALIGLGSWLDAPVMKAFLAARAVHRQWWKLRDASTPLGAEHALGPDGAGRRQSREAANHRER
jgi:CelD/BcsL family acetyltransferase involved in cellulose biosynthesis